MNTTAIDEVRVALASTARAFERPQRISFLMLLPFKDEISELRQRGASFETIRQILKRHSIITSAETVRRFFRRFVEPPAPRRRSRRRDNLRSRRATARRDADAVQQKPSNSKAPFQTMRGPRIARIEDL